MAGLGGFSLDTLSVHGGVAPDPQHGSRAQPIHLSTSFVFKSGEQAASLFNLELPGHVYSRISNPTVAALEARVAAIEGGIGGIAAASGQAALHLAIATVLSSGDHIVASRALYGGSHNLLSYTLKRFGIETSFVDPRDLDRWRAAIRPNTRLLFGESVSNPGLDVLDVPSLAELAHAHRLPLLVDATLTPPPIGRSLDLGADIVLHSATKFLGGHGTAIGGVLVDAGRFDWDASGLFPGLTEPYDGFHGMDFAEESPIAAFLLRARREGLRDFGACLSPMNAFQILQGIETLPIRMRRHAENTRRVLDFLTREAGVERIDHPELPDHPDHRLAQRLYPNGVGSVLSFELRQGRAGGRKFIESLRLFSHLANVGDTRSLVIHPASTTHFRMDDRALAAAGIGPGTIRLSIGLEDPDDLREDLARALHAVNKMGS